MGSLLNSFNQSVKSKTKSKSKCSHSSKALANAESKLMKSANAQPKGMFLMWHAHNETLDFSVISNEGNSFRLLHEDDDDLPRNLLSLLSFDNSSILPNYDVLGCCGSWIWLLFEQIDSTPPQYIVWNMETDSCRYRFPCLSPREDDDLDLWAYGMGFDPSSGHYKLLTCWVDYCLGQVYSEVLSLGTGSWKAVHYPYGSILNHDAYPSININGFYYRIATGFRDGSTAIMSFDFAEDRFRALIPLPKLYIDKSSVVLVEFQGSLAAVCCDSEDEPFIFEIWGWNARGSFWSLVSTFDIPAAADSLAVLNLYKNDKLFVVYFEGELLLYDQATRRQENLGLPIGRGGSLLVYPYVKSSVLSSRN